MALGQSDFGAFGLIVRKDKFEALLVKFALKERFEQWNLQ